MDQVRGTHIMRWRVRVDIAHVDRTDKNETRFRTLNALYGVENLDSTLIVDSFGTLGSSFSSSARREYDDIIPLEHLREVRY